MRTEPPYFDRQDFLRHVNQAYKAEFTDLIFHPVGEDSYGFIAKGSGSAFIKLYTGTAQQALSESLVAAYALRHELDLPFVVAPLNSTTGTVCTIYSRFSCAVFPWISGSYYFCPGENIPSPEKIGRIIARLHTAFTDEGDVRLRRETFTAPCTETIHQVLQAAEGFHSDPIRLMSARLLVTYRSQIIDALNTHIHEGRQLADKNSAWAFTHGDAHWANILNDAHGELFLIDWDDLSMAPPERDLAFFTGPDFQSVLASYILETGHLPDLSAARFKYYFDRWTLSEIADFGERIFLQDLPEVEMTNAWEELQQYVPLQRDQTARQVEQIERVLENERT